MINSFKELNEKYSCHSINQKVKTELQEKTFSELIRLKDKSREIIKEMVQGGVMDKEDKDFLLENLIFLSSSSTLLENSFSSLLNQQEQKLIQMIPSGFNLSTLLHPDFPYTLSFVGSNFETIIKNHEAIMKEKTIELDRMKELNNFIEIKEELEKLNKIMNTSSLDKKNRKNDIQIINKSLDLLSSCPF